VIGRATLIVATIVAAQNAAANPPSNPTVVQLERCFDEQAAKVPFSGIAAAANGDARFEHASGFVDETGSRGANADVPFRLASVQKVLTAIAIGQLVDQGKIALDAPVSRYLDGLPADLGAATIDQLLHHQSGAASFTMITPDFVEGFRAAKSARDLVSLVAAQPLAFPPGSRTEYSNGGYLLLGGVIEAVSGQTYGDYLQAGIFGPLHMAHSAFAAPADTATRYSRVSPGGMIDKPRPISGNKHAAPTAAGDGVSTAADLLTLGRALVGNQLLSNAVKERIFQRRAGPWRIGQSGGAPGTNTDFAVFPDTGWVVVVLSNFDPPGGELMGEVLRKVAVGGPCQPLGAEDRPSPFHLILMPPPPQPVKS